MSDRAALLAAICAAPDEDTPRLVYADWLDEHDDALRAAYIRGKVEFARRPPFDTEAATVCAFADDYETTYWAAAGPDVAAEVAARAADERHDDTFEPTPESDGLPDVPGVTYLHPRRGFLNGVRVADPDAFLRHADAVFRAAPVDHLMFDKLTAEQAGAFIASGRLAQIRALNLQSEVEPKALRALGLSPDAAGVRDLNFQLNPSARAAVEALAAGRFWGGLESLTAVSAREPDGTSVVGPFTECLQRGPFPRLRRLVVWASGLDDGGARAVARHFPELRFADLAINPITGPGAAALAASKALPHLRHLDLGTCNLEGAATEAARLINARNLPALNVLLLGGNFTDGLDPKALARRGRAPVLRALTLETGTFDPHHLEALARCPALRGLWHLGLEMCGVDDDGLEAFCRHAALAELIQLNLDGNEITARGLKGLAAWPGAARLQWLNLSGNTVGAAGAKALAQSPHLTNLRYLRASGRGAAALKKAFPQAFAPD